MKKVQELEGNCCFSHLLLNVTWPTMTFCLRCSFSGSCCSEQQFQAWTKSSGDHPAEGEGFWRDAGVQQGGRSSPAQISYHRSVLSTTGHHINGKQTENTWLCISKQVVGGWRGLGNICGGFWANGNSAFKPTVSLCFQRWGPAQFQLPFPAYQLMSCLCAFVMPTISMMTRKWGLCLPQQSTPSRRSLRWLSLNFTSFAVTFLHCMLWYCKNRQFRNFTKHFCYQPAKLLWFMYRKTMTLKWHRSGWLTPVDSCTVWNNTAVKRWDY